MGPRKQGSKEVTKGGRHIRPLAPARPVGPRCPRRRSPRTLESQAEQNMAVEDAVRTAKELDRAYRSPGGKRHITDLELMRAVLHKHAELDAWELHRHCSRWAL